LPRGFARQFFEQRRTIVRGHFVQDRDHLLVSHGVKQFLLGLNIEIFENVSSQRRGQDAKNDHSIVRWKIDNHLCHIGGRPIRKELPQPAKVARRDQALNFRC